MMMLEIRTALKVLRRGLSMNGLGAWQAQCRVLGIIVRKNTYPDPEMVEHQSLSHLAGNFQLSIHDMDDAHIMSCDMRKVTPKDFIAQLNHYEGSGAVSVYLKSLSTNPNLAQYDEKVYTTE